MRNLINYGVVPKSYLVRRGPTSMWFRSQSNGAGRHNMVNNAHRSKTVKGSVQDYANKPSGTSTRVLFSKVGLASPVVGVSMSMPELDISRETLSPYLRTEQPA